jgi:hypothetical protein
MHGLFGIAIAFLLMIALSTAVTAEPLVWYSDYGVSLNMGDDESRLINIGFSFTFYGNVYTQCYVNANGNITFSASDDDYTETEAEFLANGPRVAPMWNDFKPVKTTPNNVYMNGQADKLIITWNQVDEYASGQDNTFQVVLYQSSVIQYGFDNMNSSDGVKGVSSGNGSNANYEMYAGGIIDDNNIFFEWNGTGYDDSDIPPESLAVEGWMGL